MPHVPRALPYPVQISRAGVLIVLFVRSNKPRVSLSYMNLLENELCRSLLCFPDLRPLRGHARRAAPAVRARGSRPDAPRGVLAVARRPVRARPRATHSPDLCVR